MTIHRGCPAVSEAELRLWGRIQFDKVYHCTHNVGDPGKDGAPEVGEGIEKVQAQRKRTESESGKQSINRLKKHVPSVTCVVHFSVVVHGTRHKGISV